MTKHSIEFETYVDAILDAMPKGLTVEQFRQRTQIDRNAGNVEEAEEAQRLYFEDAYYWQCADAPSEDQRK